MSFAQQLFALAKEVQVLEEEASSLRRENRRLRNQVARLTREAEPKPQERPKRNPWELLGVPPGADAGQVMTAFRRLSKQHHPDTPTGNRELFEQLVLARDALLKRST